MCGHTRSEDCHTALRRENLDGDEVDRDIVFKTVNEVPADQKNWGREQKIDKI